jgi:hypothetical protein
MMEAIRAKVIHKRQRRCSKQMQADIAITTTKLCAWTSGRRPATMPAPIMRRVETEKGKKGERGERLEATRGA